MQFHHHGYVSQDPRVLPAAGVGLDRPDELPDEVDVLVVGAGPAGMMVAASLSVFPSVTSRIVERRPGRLVLGQADGIQARSVETFQAFGFAPQIIQEAYRITHANFWAPDPSDPSKIVRTQRTEDDPYGLSEFPHLIVNQARVLDYFADFMAKSPTRNVPDWGYEFVSLERAAEGEYPVTVTLRHTSGEQEGAERVVRAKYVVGTDGARSKVRDAIGRKAVGAQALHAWAVMDVLAETDFPDIRTKCVIQSSAGQILHIPREGQYLFRMYVDLGEVHADDARAIRSTTVEDAIAKANAIIAPYTLDVKEVAWYSVYEVGHRVTDRFDDSTDEHPDPRIFIAGDACHTHSAKAGQGMNVSMQDGFNLGWKLGQVLTGLAPAELLVTYSEERQVIAQNLIDFDREWSSLMAKPASEFESPEELGNWYVKTAEFPFGFATQYPENSMLIGSAEHQELATGFPLGKRFKSAMVSRVCDGNPVHLGHHHRADARYRIYAFADGAGVGEGSALAAWAQWLATDADSPLLRYTPAGADEDAVFDVKVIYQEPHDQVDFNAVPAVFKPHHGPYGLLDYEHVYAALPELDIFNERGLSRAGVVIVVRPDQYVSAILPLSDTDALAAYFAKTLLPQR